MVEDTKDDPRISHCPALVGPSELARWKVTMDFGTGSLLAQAERANVSLVITIWHIF